jgi:two-component system, chemotaxis family, chemotaxis protein CheY
MALMRPPPDGLIGQNEHKRFAMSEESDPILKLPRILDFGAAEGFLDTLRSRLRDNPRLRLDASGVEVLTVPCIQIILSALHTYDEMSVERSSAEYINAFQDLGIDCRYQADGEIEVSAELEPSTDAVSDSPPPIEESAMSKRILTIDDSKTIRDMLMLTLAEAGFEVFQAVDGQDGLDVLDKEQVDVVITDINMPRMDGYEVIRHLRNNSAHKSTPILVLTTESEADKKNLARVAGATGWMVKPFDPERLIATINKVVP